MSLVTYIDHFIDRKLDIPDPCFHLVIDPDLISSFKARRLSDVGSRTPSFASRSRSSSSEHVSYIPSIFELIDHDQLELNAATLIVGTHPQDLWAAITGHHRTPTGQGWRLDHLQAMAGPNHSHLDYHQILHHLIKRDDVVRANTLITDPQDDELNYEYGSDLREVDVIYIRDAWGHIQLISPHGDRNPGIMERVGTSYRILPRELTYKWCTLPYFYEMCLDDDDRGSARSSSESGMRGEDDDQRSARSSSDVRLRGEDDDQKPTLSSFHSHYFDLVLDVFTSGRQVKSGARFVVERMISTLMETKSLSIKDTDMSLYPPMPLRLRMDRDLYYDLEQVSSEHKIINVHSPNINFSYRGEVLELLGLNHPHLVKVHGVTIDNAFHLAVVCDTFIDLTPGYLENLPWVDRLNLCRQLAEAIYYLHSHGVIHDRLTPNRLKLDSNGKLRVLHHHFTSTLASENKDLDRVPYRAMDVYASDVLFYASDIYAMAFLYYYILHAQEPYATMPREFIVRKQLLHELPPMRAEIGPDFEELLRQATYIDPSLRPSAAQMLTLLPSN